MPKLSPEKANERREEIIAACETIVPYVYYSAYDLTYQFVKKLLG